MTAPELSYRTERELEAAIVEWRAAGAEVAHAARDIADNVARVCEAITRAAERWAE